MRTQADDAATTGHVLCRVCNKGCPMIAEVRDGRLAAVRGNKDNELFAGYTCVKGRALPAFVNGPGRLLRSQRRIAGRLRADPGGDRDGRDRRPAVGDPGHSTARGRSPPTTERSCRTCRPAR